MIYGTMEEYYSSMLKNVVVFTFDPKAFTPGKAYQIKLFNPEDIGKTINEMHMSVTDKGVNDFIKRCQNGIDGIFVKFSDDNHIARFAIISDLIGCGDYGVNVIDIPVEWVRDTITSYTTITESRVEIIPLEPDARYDLITGEIK